MLSNVYKDFSFQLQVLKAEKDKEEAHHSEEMANVISQNGREIQELESTNNQKLMAEYEKYQELQAKSQRQQEDYEKQVLDAEEAKQRKEEELTEYYETVVADKQTEVDEVSCSDTLLCGLAFLCLCVAFGFV